MLQLVVSVGSDRQGAHLELHIIQTSYVQANFGNFEVTWHPPPQLALEQLEVGKTHQITVHSASAVPEQSGSVKTAA